MFLETDRVNFQKEGFSKEEMLAGLAQVLPKNVWQYVVQIPRMASLGKKFVLQGGTQYNLAAVKAQVDYIKERVPGAEVYVHPHTGEAGAIGAAMETRRVVMRKRNLHLHRHRSKRSTSNTRPRTTKRRSVTSARTSASARSSTRRRPTGKRAATSPASRARRAPSRAKIRCSRSSPSERSSRKNIPNMVDYESKRAFMHFYNAAPMPEDGSPVKDVEVRNGILGASGV